MNTIAERVEAGAAWLDANRPGWVDRINLETLDMASPRRCILGQEYGYFGSALPDVGQPFINRVQALGFDGGAPGVLAGRWRDYITARRAAA